MTKELHSLIEAIHNTPPQAVLVLAGAGTQALADLLSVGGASRTLLEALVPYSQPAFDAFLGRTPDQYVGAATGRLLAGRALNRARQWVQGEFPVIGLACTAAIASDRPKKGEHRVHMAAWQNERLSEVAFVLAKGARDRVGEEAVVSRLILNLLAAASGLTQQVTLPLLPDEQLQEAVYDFSLLTGKLLQGEIELFGVPDHGVPWDANEKPQAILPGSFNPLHEGHLGMAVAAERILGHPVAYELSALNVDKPPLPTTAILERIAQFAGCSSIFVTRAPTFVEKARLLPGVIFVIGYDTAVRVLQPRYYGNSDSQMWAAVDEIKALGASFLVAGRVDNGGVFHTLADMEVPARAAGLFAPIPPDEFRLDISSTTLRARHKG